MAKEKQTIDTHNRVGSDELVKIIDTQLDAIEANPVLSRTIPPLMIWGAPGLGKSTIVKEIAKRRGIKFIDVRLAQMEPVDIRGLPVPDREKKSVDWFVNGAWPRAEKDANGNDKPDFGILFFDEISAADRSVQVAAYELILDRRLGQLYNLPDGWLVVGAGNRTEDRAVSTTMSSALANRFMHVEVEASMEDWARWATKNEINPSVIGFITYRPECLFRQEDENLERGWPTPRAWERVSEMINAYKGGADDTVFRKIVYGLVGNRAGVEFVEFHKINNTFDSVLEMMTNPKAKINIPEKPDQKYAFTAAMTYLLWKGKDKNDEKNRITGFFRICNELSSDFASLAMMNALVGTKDLSGEDAAEKIFEHPQYETWAERHGKALKKRYVV